MVLINYCIFIIGISWVMILFFFSLKGSVSWCKMINYNLEFLIEILVLESMFWGLMTVVVYTYFS